MAVSMLILYLVHTWIEITKWAVFLWGYMLHWTNLL